MSEIILSSETIDAIARRVVQLQRETAAPADSDPWLTREQAAAYLNFSPSSFERARRAHPEKLKPISLHPVRFSRNALDAFKFSQGPSLVRRGRRPGSTAKVAA